VAERKKRYPSKANVEQRKRKAQEAAERGEIDSSQLTAKSRKRRKMDTDGPSESRNDEGERGRCKGRGRGHGAFAGKPDSGWGGRGRGKDSVTISPHQEHQLVQKEEDVTSTKPLPIVPDSRKISSSPSAGSSSETSDSNSDMDPVLDAISSKRYPGNPCSTKSNDDAEDNPELCTKVDIADQSVKTTTSVSDLVSLGYQFGLIISVANVFDLSESTTLILRSAVWCDLTL